MAEFCEYHESVPSPRSRDGFHLRRHGKNCSDGGGFVLAFPPGSPEGDVELFARWREYLRLETELNAAEGNRDLINWKARQLIHLSQIASPTATGKVVPTEVDADAELCTTADLQPGWQSAAERMAEAEAWAQKCEAIRVRFGLPELETAFKTAWDRQWAAFARFVATPATTLTGLAFKTSAIFYFADETRRAWRGTLIEKRQLEPDQEISAHTQERSITSGWPARRLRNGVWRGR